MNDFRYAQFCPLTRAVEILGERWTILIVRELLPGPKRFSDLKTALNGVSPSVLADRLAKLEERGIVGRRELPQPSSSSVYVLEEPGRALHGILVELMRWGLRFMGSPDPDDSIRPEWLLLGLTVFARSGATAPISAHLHIGDDDDAIDLYVKGGAHGTDVSRTPSPCDVTIAGPAMEMLMFASGSLLLESQASAYRFTCEGDLDVIRRIPSLFDFRPTPAPPPATSRPSPVKPAKTRRATAPAARDPRKTGAVDHGPEATAAPRGPISPACDSGRALQGA